MLPLIVYCFRFFLYRYVFPVAMPFHVVTRISSLDRTTCKGINIYFSHCFLDTRFHQNLIPSNIAVSARAWGTRSAESLRVRSLAIRTRSGKNTSAFDEAPRNWDTCRMIHYAASNLAGDFPPNREWQLPFLNTHLGPAREDQ